MSEPKKPESYPEIAGKKTHDKINELVPGLLSGPKKDEQEQYAGFLDEYDSVFQKLRNIAEERDVDGLSKAQIELDPAGNEPKAKIEEAMGVAFGNLPEVFEGFREMLRRTPNNSFVQNIESLEQLKFALKDLLDYFAELQENLKTDNAELMSAISIAGEKTDELMMRVTGVVDSMEELLSRSRG
jgi:hypothetical protein